MLKQQQTPYANFWKMLHSAREWAGLVIRNSWKNSPKKHLRGTSLCLSNERWKRLPKSPLPSASSHQQEKSPASRKRITDESEPWNMISQSCVSVSFSEIPSDPRAQVTRPAGAGRVTRGRRSRDPRARVAGDVPKRNRNKPKRNGNQGLRKGKQVLLNGDEAPRKWPKASSNNLYQLIKFTKSHAHPPLRRL